MAIYFFLEFMHRTLLTRNLKQRLSRWLDGSSSSWSQKQRSTSKTPRTNTVMIKIVMTWSEDIGIFSISVRASRTRSFFGLNSRAWRKCKMLSWMFPYFLNISPSVKYWRHALVADEWTSNDLKWNSYVFPSQFCSQTKNFLSNLKLDSLSRQINRILKISMVK